VSVISVRVEKDVKEALKKAGIDISEKVRRYLEDLAWQTKLDESISELNRLLQDMKPAERGYSSKSVREDRDSN